MDSLQLAMLDVPHLVPHELVRDAEFRADLREALLMGASLDWPTPDQPTYGNLAAGWGSRGRGELDALAGLCAVRARLWGPWYGQRPEVVPLRKRDPLGELIQRVGV
mgnify:FL=1